MTGSLHHSRGAQAGTRVRSETLDAVRAVALMGVLLVNMMTISGLTYLTPEARALAGGFGDRAVWAVVVVAVEGKALSAFSFLFGLSFSIIMANAMAQGDGYMAFFLRRLAVLGLFGLLNVTFFFWADILITYAVLGLGLPLAAMLPRRGVLALAGALLVGVPVAMAAAGFAPPAPLEVSQVESLRAFASPHYIDTVRHNWALYLGAVGEPDGMRGQRYAMLAGLFLLGLGMGQSGVQMRLGENSHWIAPAGWALLCSGAALELAHLSGLIGGRVATLLGMEEALMALGYLGLLALLLERRGAIWLRRRLAPLGRLALSGYLMGGLAGQIVFYGWGLGRIGEAGVLEVLGWSVLIFGLMLVFAELWTRAFLFGPWEWLWRSLSRMQLQPILRSVR